MIIIQEYLDYRYIDESQSGSSRQQSVVPSAGSKRSSFIDSELLTGSQQQQLKKLKSSKSEKSFVWKYFKKLVFQSLVWRSLRIQPR
ncbi:hypothetical protein RclHR1_10950004 [Rhizophagus clarus]|uniref:Uncharacterized protein n=1 Tax=Rhizophagus clarus TaxID=94130 RepID=A0A2Z6QF37_9GLOM|nr:hypothetical protein RclHR1_10950004 [Rhizophagus clarus]GET03116.1 hypothetical protein RCL_jg8302.t1 [Rhizophagus clarus]